MGPTIRGFPNWAAAGSAKRRNPPPSPAEVFRYFETLPLPQLVTQHQPPGDGLAGLPVIFYTDSPTTQTFTVDIRGFTVVIDATNLEFIDVRGLLTLDRHAAASDAIMVLRSPPTVVTRLTNLVDLIALRVEGGR